MLIRTSISEASIGGFKLTDLSLPRTILPAVIAFVYYEMMGSLAVISELQERCASLLRLTHPLVWKEGLLPTMLPPQPAMFGSELESLKGIAIVKVARVFQRLTQIVLVSAPVIYVGWAAWLELTEFGAPGWEELVAVAVAALFLVFAIILSIAGAQISRTSYVVPGKADLEDSAGQSP